MHRLLLLPFVLVLTGCYTLRPVGATPREGTRVALDLNDAGRVAMAERIGPEILQLEGRLLSVENGDYTMAVKAVRYVRGGEQIWAGERVRIQASHVSTTWERRFSPGRTALLAAGTVGAVAAVFIGRELATRGSEPPGPRPDPNPDAIVWPPASPKP